MSSHLWQREPEVVDSLAFERSLESQGYRLVAGIDEAGRGPLAGPVVAACVVLPAGCEASRFRDSKQLKPELRCRLAAEIEALPGVYWGVGVVAPAEIDRLNILQASLLAMQKAVAALAAEPDFLLVDGKHQLPLPLPQQALVRGDSRSASIAAASIIAKVRRDEIMADYHRRYPQYNFHRHKGYGTAEHLHLLRQHGPCPIHRRSFKPVGDCLRGGDD
ncbi:ribonuclease HII [Desulfurivibrio alkaliphilus]|uniref:Ribonuclease HII n=1 Tax=Desulfurivibrio alkaliphilus (strain DSM 19089 / UNIQEM U267 / AHT2) TaxID=589865 RepID=D6Z2U0_DESAT|nr:ribonuclease HII [Desulfurivibrio alkaliphilus]ADH85865.1 Ribonuclease H [Desulfurivibrio alkaliphilus AHT 2]